MPGEPAHKAVGAADRLPAADAFQVIFTSQLIELAAAITGRAQRHHQFLFIKGSFESIRAHLNDRYLQQIFFLKSRVAININFDKTVGIARL
jgi:hypothetical protein